HPGRQLVTVPCAHCGVEMEGVPALLSALTACDDCRAKAEREAAEEKWGTYWENHCPATFRATDRNHVDFPRAQANELRGWLGEVSLFFYGESGTGKTRLAYWLMKRTLLRRGWGFAVLRPIDLREAARAFEQKAILAELAKAPVLLIDDPFRDGVSERAVSFLVDLVDVRMEDQRPFVVTSQVNGEDVRHHLDKYL